MSVTALPFGPWAVILSLTALLILNSLMWLARRHKTATVGARRAQLGVEVAYLRREAAKLNQPATYAKCAKFQRLANAKEKELGELGSTPAVPGLAERLVLVGNAFKVLLLGGATLLLWDTPVAQVSPSSLLSPLGRLLAFPRGAELAPFGVITMVPWLALCDMATQAVLRAAFPVPTFGPQQAARMLDGERLAKEAEGAGRIRPVSSQAVAAAKTGSVVTQASGSSS